MIGKISGHTLSRRGHGIVALFPVGRTHISTLLGKLQGIKNSQGLINTSSQRQIIDHLTADNTVLSIRNRPRRAMPMGSNTPYSLRNTLVQISNQGKLDIADTAGIDRRILPGQMGKMRVN